MSNTIYDVFISYRRDGGFSTASHINDRLVNDGYSVSYDIDTLREGRFDEQLLKRIEQCSDFVLIVDKNCFERTFDPNTDPKEDWLRQELAYALKLKKNVIPILLAGAIFPKGLPADIEEVRRCQGPKHTNEYFDSFYIKLKSYLHAEPRKTVSPKFDDSIYSSIARCPNLKIRADLDCIFYIDGEERAKLKAGVIRKFPLIKGEYELRFVSLENASDFLTFEFEMPEEEKLQNVSLCPVRDKRLNEEKRIAEEERKKAEARRIAEEKRREEERREAEARRIAEEKRRENERREAEVRRIEEEEERKKAEARRIAEEERQEIERRKAEDRRIAEEESRKIAEEKKMKFYSLVEKCQKAPFRHYDSPEELYYEGLSWEFTKSPREFAALITAAEQGYPPAQITLGEDLISDDAKELGIYDELQSKEWCNKAISGYKDSIKKLEESVKNGNDYDIAKLGDYYHKLGSYYWKGTWGDVSLAEKYYKMGAELGDKDCQRGLGMILREYGRSKDALYWFMKSGEQGEDWAACLAGEMYEKGEGTQKNIRKAIKWYRKSAKIAIKQRRQWNDSWADLLAEPAMFGLIKLGITRPISFLLSFWPTS